MYVKNDDLSWLLGCRVVRVEEVENVEKNGHHYRHYSSIVHTQGQHHVEASQIVKIVNFFCFHSNKTFDLYCFMSYLKPLQGLCAFSTRAKILNFEVF